MRTQPRERSSVLITAPMKGDVSLAFLEAIMGSACGKL